MDKTLFDVGKEKEREQFLLTQALATYTVSKELQNMAEKLSNTAQIDLFNQSFVFIMDGVDELGQKYPVHLLYDAPKWCNSFFVIAARTGFFTDRYGYLFFLYGYIRWESGVYIYHFPNHFINHARILLLFN